MIDDFMYAVDEAEREVAIGGAGVAIAASMMRALRRAFPVAYVMPHLDWMGTDPTAPRWDYVRAEVMAAAGAMLGQHQTDAARRKVQPQAAARRPRRSKWDAYRVTLEPDLEKAGASSDDGVEELAGKLFEEWRRQGRTPLPPLDTVIKWLRKWRSANKLRASGA